MDHDPKSNTTPLLSSKRASKLQTLGNIIVTVVGTGVLGLPFAFRIAGWVAGSIGVAIVGISTYYCMLLLVGHLHFFSLFFFSISFHYLEFFYFIFQLLKM
jgi:proton-coupled amino acid transporter